MKSRKKTQPKRSPASPAPHPGFAKVVKAFAKDRDVALPGTGKGFGSSGLKIGGRIFAMLSSKEKFVVKLPKERVDALVGARKGGYFDPGHGRLMKEWLEMKGNQKLWVRLAKEARDFVKENKKR